MLIRMPLNSIIMKNAPKIEYPSSLILLFTAAISAGPIQVQVPPEEDLVPPGGNHAPQGFRRDPRDGDDADGDGRDRKDAELQHLGNHHAEHAAFHHVESGDAHQDQRVLVGGEMPRKEIGGELADAFEAIGEESDDAHQREDHYDHVRKLRAAPVPNRVRIHSAPVVTLERRSHVDR